MSFFKVQDKKQPDKERRLSTLYLIKHKKTPEANQKAFEQENEDKDLHPVIKGSRNQ